MLYGSTPQLDLSYDPAGRLHRTSAETATRFLYDGDQLVAEYSDSGTLLRHYVPGPGVDEYVTVEDASAGRRWLLTDRLGSVVALVDGSGEASALNSYGPFGEPGAGGIGLDQGRIRYTGQMYLPEAGLYHYKARTYSHKWGRFLQPDPAGSADDLNPYTYADNDPINLVDPTGMFADSARRTANILGTAQVHGTLDGIGVFDPTGIADALNAGLYAAKGDWVNAGLSAAGIIPIIGDLAKGGKYGANALKAAERVPTGWNPEKSMECYQHDGRCSR